MKIHQFAPSRKDRNVEIEVTVQAIDEYVKAGKIGGVGLSEVSAETLRRAAKVAEITSVEVAVSLWDTDILTNGLVEACAELDIPILAYCEYIFVHQFTVQSSHQNFSQHHLAKAC